MPELVITRKGFERLNSELERLKSEGRSRVSPDRCPMCQAEDAWAPAR